MEHNIGQILQAKYNAEHDEGYNPCIRCKYDGVCKDGICLIEEEDERVKKYYIAIHKIKQLLNECKEYEDDFQSETIGGMAEAYQIALSYLEEESK